MKPINHSFLSPDKIGVQDKLLSLYVQTNETKNLKLALNKFAIENLRSEMYKSKICSNPA